MLVIAIVAVTLHGGGRLTGFVAADSAAARFTTAPNTTVTPSDPLTIELPGLVRVKAILITGTGILAQDELEAHVRGSAYSITVNRTGGLAGMVTGITTPDPGHPLDPSRVIVNDTIPGFDANASRPMRNETANASNPNATAPRGTGAFNRSTRRNDTTPAKGRPASGNKTILSYGNGPYDVNNDGFVGPQDAVDFHVNGTPACVIWTVVSQSASLFCRGDSGCCEALGFPYQNGSATNLVLTRSTADGVAGTVLARTPTQSFSDPLEFSFAATPERYVTLDAQCGDACSIDRVANSVELTIGSGRFTVDSVEVVYETLNGTLVNETRERYEPSRGSVAPSRVGASARPSAEVQSSLVSSLDKGHRERVIIRNSTGMHVRELRKAEFDALVENGSVGSAAIDQPVSALGTDALGITGISAVQNATGLSGAGETICVVDTGVNVQILRDAHVAYTTWNVLTNTSDATDGNGHGTEVTYPLVQSAPGARYVIVKALDDTGSGYESDIIRGLDYCRAQGADIISLSIGSGLYGGLCDANILASEANALASNGTLIVAAAGNEGGPILKSPACASNVTAVINVKSDDTLASDTSYFSGHAILAAPGVSIDTLDKNANPTTASGTSMATPFVSGAAALLLENQTNLTPLDVRDVMIGTGRYENTTSLNYSRLDLKNALAGNYTNNLSGTRAGVAANTSNGTANQTVATLSTISSCQTLSTSGTYQLTTDLTASAGCMDITASNVKLDCQNHLINYSQSSAGSGIEVATGLDSVTIGNCRVEQGSTTDAGQAIRISYGSMVSTNILIENVSVVTYGNDSRGLQFENVSSATVHNATIVTYGSQLSEGLYFYATKNAYGSDINTTGYANPAVQVWTLSNNITIDRMTAASHADNIKTIAVNGPNLTIKHTNATNTYVGGGVSTALWTGNAANNTIVIDSRLIGTDYGLWAGQGDLYVYNSTLNDSSNNGVWMRVYNNPNDKTYLVNVTPTTNIISWFTGQPDGKVYYGWWADLYVNDTIYGPFSNVRVDYNDNGAYTGINPSGSGYVTTGSDGYYRGLPVYSWVANRTLTRYLNNYTFNATKSGYSNYSVRIVNMTSNRQINFSMQVGTPISSCQTLSSAGEYVLTQDLSSSSTCITIGASNVVFSCSGHSITYDTGANGYRYGVQVSSGSNNVTVRDCTFINTNDASNSYGVWAAGTGTGAGRVTNLTVQGIMGTQYSDLAAVIGLRNTTDATIRDSVLNASGNGGFELGIRALYSTRVTVVNVTVNASGSNFRTIDWENSVNFTLENSSTFMYPSAHQAQGLNILDSTGSVVRNLRATSSGQTEGIIVLNGAHDTAFINVTTSGTGASVTTYYSAQSWDNYFYNSTLNTTGSGYYSAILFTSTTLASNITFINSTYSSAEYDGSSGSTDYQLYSGWYTDLYVNDTLGGPISGAKVNYTDSGVRSSKNPTSSGQISVGTDGRYHDLVLYQYVENYTGRYSFNNYTFNATKTGYSNYSIARSNISSNKQINLTMSVATATSACGTISSSGIYQLTQDVSAPATCFTISSDNVTLDCDGHTITYSQSSGGLGVTVNAGINNTVIRKCTIVQGAGGADSSDPIDLVASTGSRIVNVTIENVNLTTSIDTGGEGIWAQHVDNLAVRNATILHSGATNTNWESVYYLDVQGGSIENSYINATRYGPRFDNISNFVIGNTTFYQSTGSGRGGPRFYTATQNVTMANVTITSSTPDVSVYSTNADLTIANSTIIQTGSSTTVDLLAGATGANVYLINTTETGGTGSSVADGSLYTGWYANLYVNDTLGNGLPNIGISYADGGAYGTNPTASGSVTTGSGGYKHDVLVYESLDTSSGQTSYNNYTFTANDATFTAPVVKSVNMTTNRLIVFTASVNGVFVVNQALNATSIHNTSLDNLTVHYSMVSATSNATDWRLDGVSIAELNMPFDVNVSSVSSGAVEGLSTHSMTATLGNGTPSNAPTWNSSCRIGGCYTFDGNDYIEVDNSTGLSFSGSQPFTISVWVYPTDLSGSGTDRVVISKYNSHVDGSWMLVVEGNIPYIDRETSPYWIASNTTINTGSWQLLTATYDGSQLRLYVDGQQTANQTEPAGIGSSPSVPILIGGDLYSSSPASFFTGSIDDVKILGRALSSSQIKDLYDEGIAGHTMTRVVPEETNIGDNWSVSITAYNTTDASAATLTNSLIVMSPYQLQNVTLTASPNDFTVNDNITASFDVTRYGPSSVSNATDWRLEGVSIDALNAPLDENVSSVVSGAVHDISTYGNNGTLGGGTSSQAPTWVSSCVVGGCYQLDATDDYIDFGDPADGSLDPGSGSFSYGLWVYPISNVGAYDMPLYKGGASNGDTGYDMELGSGAWGSGISDGTTGVASYYSPISGPTGGWYFVVEVVDRSANLLKMYINGTQVDSDSISAVGSIDSTKSLYLGHDTGGGNQFNGRIDQPFVMHRALTTDQIKAMYQAGLAGHASTKIVSNMTSVGENWSALINDYADGILQDSAVTGQQQIHTPSACGSITSDTTLYNNVSSSGTCYTITASNVVLDCAGHTITYGTGGGSNLRGVRVGSAYSNLAVKNCNIVQGSSGITSSYGFQYSPGGTRGSNITLQNVNITSQYGDYWSMQILNADDVTIDTSTQELTGTGQGGGIYLDGTNNTIITHLTSHSGSAGRANVQLAYNSNYTTVRDSSFNRTGSGGSVAISSYGGSHDHTVDNVTVVSTTSSSDWGIEPNSPMAISNVDIAMTASGSYGIYLREGNSTIENAVINTQTSGRGLYIRSGPLPVTVTNVTATSQTSNAVQVYQSGNITITDLNASAPGVGGHGFDMGLSDNVTVKDSTISGDTDVVLQTDTGPGGLKFVNVTYNDANNFIDTDSQSILHVGWWADLYVNDTSGNLVPGATINYTDNGVASSTNPKSSGQATSGPDGYQRNVPLYGFSETNGGTTYHTNYTFNVSKSPYTVLVEQQENITTNRQITLTLHTDTCTPPGGGDWTVSIPDNCTVSSTVNIYPNTLHLTGKGGSFTIASGGTLIAKNVDYAPSALDGSSTFIVKTGGNLNVKP